MTIIWGAFMAATVIYVFLAWIMFGQAEPTIADAEASLPAPVAPILGVLAFLVILASIFVERWWFSGARILAQLARPAAFDRLASARGSAAGAATAGAAAAGVSSTTSTPWPGSRSKRSCKGTPMGAPASRKP